MHRGFPAGCGVLCFEIFEVTHVRNVVLSVENMVPREHSAVQS